MKRYKAVLSSGKLYREVELEPEAKYLEIGTGKDCRVRMDIDLFFEEFGFRLENEDGAWTLVCAENIYASADGVLKLSAKPLVHGDSLLLKYKQSGQAILTIHFTLDFEYEYKDYERVIDLAEKPSFTIGGAAGCDILLEDPLIGKDSILAENSQGRLLLHDNATQYGVYVNGIRMAGQAEVRDTDFFSIIGYSFYYKFGQLYTSKSSRLVIEGLPHEVQAESDGRFAYPCFNRNTRIKDPLPAEEISILDPPQKPEKDKQNVLLQILPTVAMMGVTVMMATQMGSSASMAIRSIAMVGVTILVAVIGLFSRNKDFKQETLERETKYRAYIERKKEEIQQKRRLERGIREDIYLPPEKELDLVHAFSSDLFDRIPEDSDFLHLRVGTGAVLSSQPVAYKEQETLEVGDELTQMPSALAQEFASLPAAPIVVDGLETGAIGIVGSRARLYEMLKNTLLDMATRHYYDDVQFFLMCSEALAPTVAWARLLPHLLNERMGVRNIVCDEESKNALFEYLYKELALREEAKQTLPRLVIFSYADPGLKSHPISGYFARAAELGVTFLFFEEKKHHLPLGCGKILQLNSGDSTGTVVSSGDNNQNIAFSFEPVEDGSAEAFVQKLAPVYCEEVSLESNLTKNISLFELLDIYSPKDLNLAQRWQSSEVHKSMAAPLGVNSKVEIVCLDLHEKYHGPHGLVAGTTGSGKSEILQSYILSMASLFHPYEVSFVIIDFKGGGMVNQFKDLPHLNGSITNIDGREINRSLLSIKAELRKRQELFFAANVNHINAYIQLFKKGEVQTPLPHLILISDEFAELKMDQPEFMKEIMSVARIGRSLGVHLILATQKPSGVVDDQIWSNSKFKLCLKVQNQQDSNEVLKSPLAAEIREPGRAYLQVGNNEIFELFQSAYSGAPAVADAEQQKRFKLYGLNLWGKKQLIFEQKPPKSSEEAETQLDALVQYIAAYAEENHIGRLPGICLPPLRENIPFAEAQPLSQEMGGIALPLGVYDDPANQRQLQYTLDLLEGNTFIVGATQYGKTSLLQLLTRSLAERYSPEEVSLYILDFASMALKIFDGLAHVGGVVTASEDVKLKTFFRMMTREVAQRKDKLSKLGITSFASYKESGFKDLPFILILLDNIAAFREMYEGFDDELLGLCREGLSVGIGVVATTAQTRSLGYKYLANFANRIALFCNTKDEYNAMFERCRMEPKDTPGRALVALNKEVYECQAFLPFAGEKEIERVEEIRAFMQQTAQRWPQRARRIPEVPDLLTPEYLAENFDAPAPYTVFAGMDYDTVDAVRFDLLKMGYLAICGREGAGRKNMLIYLLQALDSQQGNSPVSVSIFDDYSRRLENLKQLSMVKEYSAEFFTIETAIEAMVEESNARKSVVQKKGISALHAMPLLVCIIHNQQFFEKDGVSRNCSEAHKNLLKIAKDVKLLFIYFNLENEAISFSGAETKKQIKENKNILYFDDIDTMRVYDPSIGEKKAHKRPLDIGDAIYVTERSITRIKTPLAKEV